MRAHARRYYAKATAAWRSWREMAVYRRAAQALFADARMLPGAEFLRRWQHQRDISARMAEAFEVAQRLFRRRMCRWALDNIKSFYASENGVGAMAMAAGSFCTSGRITQSFRVWSRAAREGASATRGLRSALGKWSHQALAFAFERLAILASNQAMMRRVLTSLRQGALVKATRTWAEMAAEAIEARGKMKSAVRRMKKADLTYAFLAVRAAQERRLTRERLVRQASRGGREHTHPARWHANELIPSRARALGSCRRRMSSRRR